MTESPAQHYLADALQTFRDYKNLVERAFAQITDEDFFKTIDEESNSIAVNSVRSPLGATCRRYGASIQ